MDCLGLQVNALQLLSNKKYDNSPNVLVPQDATFLTSICFGLCDCCNTQQTYIHHVCKDFELARQYCSSRYHKVLTMKLLAAATSILQLTGTALIYNLYCKPMEQNKLAKSTQFYQHYQTSITFDSNNEFQSPAMTS